MGDLHTGRTSKFRLFLIRQQQHPFAEFKYPGLPNLIAGVCTGARPTIPEETPAALRITLEKGWNADPAVRPSFQEMMSNHIFDTIITEAVAGGEELVAKLMRELNISAGNIPNFLDFFRKTPNTNSC